MKLTKKQVNDLAYQVVGAAIEVHRELGPGLLESVYEQCLVKEMFARGIKAERQVAVPISYKGQNISTPLRIDLLVEDCLVLELKAVEQFAPIFQAQLLTYLKLAAKPKGLLLNFNCTNLTKEGLVPMVNEIFAALPEE